MGLYSRDYYRDLTPSPWSFDGAPVVKWVIVANVVVFLLQILVVRPPRMTDAEFQAQIEAKKDTPPTPQEIHEWARVTQPEPVLQGWLELDTAKVVRGGQVWRLLTHAFCHDRLSVFHILFNMLLLFWFGRTLELMYGPREFLLFYLTAAAFAGLAFVGLDLYTGSNIPAVGASGAVMAVLMLYTMHFPCETICVCWFFPLEMWWLMALFVIWDLHPVLLALSGSQYHTGVAHAAHLGGLLFGFLYAKYGWRLETIAEFIPWPGGRVAVRAHPRPAAVRRPTACESGPVAARVDQVLEKISVSGQASLTDEERDVLRAASERMKARAGK